MKGIRKLCLALVVCIQMLHAQPRDPNIIIIIADDLGYGDISCYNGKIKTPNIDRLAAEGLRFTDFHTSGTVCSPTRAGLLTGLYQHRVGVPGVIVAMPGRREHDWGLDRQAASFPRLLKQDGYATGLFGKWHLGYSGEFNPLHYGFDRFKGYLSGQVDYQSHVDLSGAFDWWDGVKPDKETGYTTQLINKHSIDFIQENKDRPFCLVVAHQAVHSPYQGPDDKPFRRTGISTPGIPAGDMPRPLKETFELMLQEMDEGLGQILQTLDRLDLSANTCIIFLSDNGGVLNVSSNAPFRGGKTQVWEGGHRVPAIIHWPGRINAGTVSEEPCISLDIMPTVLDFAGVARPEGFRPDGISLSDLLFNKRPPCSRRFFWHAENSDHVYAVREENWKLVNPGKGKALLFDLSRDQGENHDLSGKHPEMVKKLQDAYQAWAIEVGVNMNKYSKQGRNNE